MTAIAQVPAMTAIAQGPAAQGQAAANPAIKPPTTLAARLVALEKKLSRGAITAH